MTNEEAFRAWVRERWYNIRLYGRDIVDGWKVVH